LKEEIAMRLFGGSKYNDDQLTSQAMAAVTHDPMIRDPAGIVVHSKHGILTLSGTAHDQQERERIEGVVRNAITTVGLNHEQIVNELRIPQTAG
jgi:osmotically-inducible protein OsmY